MIVKLGREFKEFAIKGNMMDIAIGVIIGSAFNKVVDVLVKDIFLPPLALLTDGMSWSNKKLILREATNQEGIKKLDEIAIGYGKLLESFADFLTIGITVFLVVKFMNKIRSKAQDPKNKTVSTPKDIELLNRITELMEKQVEIAERNSILIGDNLKKNS